MNPLTRRKFLEKSALAAVAVPAFSGLILSSSKAQPVVGANDRIRVGVIGCGGMGRGNLATFLTNPEVDCAVICDVDDAQIAKGIAIVEKQRKQTPESVKDFRRVLDRNDLDAVIISTPDHWHAIPTVLACQASKDIYVEKPLATSIAEGRAMLEATKRHNRVVQMGAPRRDSVHIKEAAEIVRSGKLGKVGMVRGWAHLDWLGGVGNPPDSAPPAGVDYDMWLGPAPKRPFNPNRFHFNFRWFWDYAGGLMTDWGVHLIDVLLFGMPKENPISVSSIGGKYVLSDNSETPDTQIALYEFPSFTLVWEHKVGTGLGLNGRPWGMSWGGSEGTLILNDAGYEIISEPKKKSLEHVEVKGTGDPRGAHVRNFLDCMKTRAQPTTNLEIGHHVSTIAHLGNIALRSNSRVVWDAKNEHVIDNKKADKLVSLEYRKPWKLPYLKRS